MIAGRQVLAGHCHQRFRDRMAAGQLLAQELLAEGLVPSRDRNTVVLALPRGGVPVAFEVARALQAPLDVLVVRKLGHPDQPELAMGALARGQARALNPEIVRGVSRKAFDRVVAQEQRECERREHRYRGERAPLAVRGRHVIIVDDGVATGASMRAALSSVRVLEPASITVAVPVGPSDVLAGLQPHADELICLRTPSAFGAISLWYDHFEQVSDETVTALLQQASAWGRMKAPATPIPSIRPP